MINETWTRILTEEDYLENCADVYFGEDAGQSIATSDGRIMGNFGGQELKGTWHWADGYFCRTSTIGETDLGSDSIVIEITDSKMRLTLEKGEGPSVVYDRKGSIAEGFAMPDDVTILSTFDIKPEGIDHFIKAMVENQEQVRKETGNLEMRMFQDVNQPSKFFVFGRTSGRAGLEAHEEEVEDRGIEQEVAGTLNEAPVTRWLGLTSQGAEYGLRDRQQEADELIVFALFDFKPGYRDRVLAQYDKQVPLVRQDDANILFDVYTLEGEDDKLVVYERWVNQALAQEFATTKPISIETGKLLAEAVKGDLPDYLFTLSEISPYL